MTLPGMPRESGGESVAEQMIPWLLRQKITVPDRVPGYVHRAELVSRALPTRRRLTVLNASGGFGKTTLLAECCRRLRQDGVATAWVALDEQDEPAVLDTYIAFACHDAGLHRLDVSELEGSSADPESRVGVLLRQIRTLGRPFVIAFDELERLTNPASVSAVGVSAATRALQSASRDRLPANPGRTERGRCGARWPGGGRGHGRSAVLETGGRQILRSEPVAQRTGRGDGPFGRLAVCTVHFSQPQGAPPGRGHMGRSGCRQELGRVAAVRESRAG